MKFCEIVAKNARPKVLLSVFWLERRPQPGYVLSQPIGISRDFSNRSNYLCSRILCGLAEYW
jgi:hypothetical protein